MMNLIFIKGGGGYWVYVGSVGRSDGWSKNRSRKQISVCFCCCFPVVFVFTLSLSRLWMITFMFNWSFSCRFVLLPFQCFILMTETIMKIMVVIVIIILVLAPGMFVVQHAADGHSASKNYCQSKPHIDRYSLVTGVHDNPANVDEKLERAKIDKKKFPLFISLTSIFFMQFFFFCFFYVFLCFCRIINHLPSSRYMLVVPIVSDYLC